MLHKKLEAGRKRPARRVSPGSVPHPRPIKNSNTARKVIPPPSQPIRKLKVAGLYGQGVSSEEVEFEANAEQCQEQEVNGQHDKRAEPRQACLDKRPFGKCYQDHCANREARADPNKLTMVAVALMQKAMARSVQRKAADGSTEKTCQSDRWVEAPIPQSPQPITRTPGGEPIPADLARPRVGSTRQASTRPRTPSPPVG